MGAGFVILLHLFAILIVSVITAVIATILTAVISNREKKTKKIVVAFFAPFLFFFGTYFLALTGAIVISSNKKVDIGIGDYWYAPLNETCYVSFIDMPESASIGCGDENSPSLIDNVTGLQQRDAVVYGKADSVYFSIDLPTQAVQKFPDADALKKSLRTDNLDLVETERFYRDRKWEVSGVLLIVVGISAVIIAGAITFLFGRLVLFGISPKRNL